MGLVNAVRSAQLARALDFEIAEEHRQVERARAARDRVAADRAQERLTALLRLVAVARALDERREALA